MSLCEAAAYYRAQGITLWDQMINIFEKYGYYKEAQLSITLEGVEGAEKIKQMMTNMRSKDVKQIGDYKVLNYKDMNSVLYYELENDSWCAVRPSGTEPKIKLYYGVKGNCEQCALSALERTKEALQELVCGN